MSGKIVGMVFDHYHAAGAELLLAVKLADNAHDDGGRIFPSVNTLAEATRQSERSVQYQIKRMLATGWLELVREARGGGRGGGKGWPREYRINPVWVRAHDSKIPEAERPAWVPKMGAEVAPISRKKRVQPGAEMGAIAVAEMGATAIAPEPSVTVRELRPPSPPPAGGERFESGSGEDAGSAFARLVAEYPRKRVNLHRARTAWEDVPPAQHAVVLVAVKVMAATPQWQAEGGRFAPKLSSWLRNQGWKDPAAQHAPPPPSAAPAAAAPAAPIPADVRAKINALLPPGRRKAVAA